MRKKLLIIVFSIFFITSTLTINVFAGDENDPKIIDNEHDWFGSFIDHPLKYKIFHSIGLLTMESYDFLDIKSAWFHEKSDEPEYLYASIQLKNLEIISQRAVYSIHWTFNGLRYAIGSHIYNDGESTSCKIGLDKHFSIFSKFKDAEYNYDYDTNIITFKFKKEHAGNLQEGDILTNTWAWTALRFNYEPMTILFSDGELVKDAAPFIENANDYGKDYIIKY